jgi:DNA primase catalytic core
MAWRIPEADIAAVKAKTDLVALVQSRGIALAKHGSKDWRGLCPFHDDRENPNFIVSPEKGLFHCMNCGAAGNAIQFVQKHDGVSFRHAFELLQGGGAAAFAAVPKVEVASVPRLPCPLDAAADDAALCAQVAGYYRERLLATPGARGYLQTRGLNDDGLIDRFQLGFADRTLGLRLPDSNRLEGEKLRTRLQALGLWRQTGHEHFNGCLVMPLRDETGKIVSFYGRRVQQNGELRHLYPPGPHQGFFNPAALVEPEVILCEAVLDALTFVRHGFANATCIYGTEGMTGEIWEKLRRARRVLLAYDADEAGDRAGERDLARLKSIGVEAHRVRFPWSLDANAYALKVQPAGRSLALLLDAARGGRSMVPARGAAPGPAAPAEPSPRGGVAATAGKVDGRASPAAAMVVVAKADPSPAVSVALSARGSSLAASVSGLEDAAKEKSLAAEPMAPRPAATAAAPAEVVEASTVPVPVIPAANGLSVPVLQLQGSHHYVYLDGREYRLGGLDKAAGVEVLKVTLRVRVGERFYLDQVDLCRDGERRRFAERAAEETLLTVELLRRDLGKVLLAAEQAVETRLAAVAAAESASGVAAGAPEMTAAERAEALAWLQAPDLTLRIRTAFHAAGMIGEEANALVAYLACVSRQLEKPLAVIVQSASAAGKTTLMEHVLAFFPEESRVKYSALTGQSLYYLGEHSLRHKILAVVEEAGAEKASYALKLLQSEGELTIASTGKDPASGRMVTQEYHVEGPVMIFLTTTAIDLDEELQNRCLTLAVDESAGQTARIHALQRERRTLAGLAAREERKDLLRMLRNAQRLLRPLAIVNPYATALTFPAERTRARRDHEKYLTLIDAIALLHQHQRRVCEHVVGGRAVEYVEVTVDDVALANELAGGVLGRSLDELPPQTRALLGHIRDLVRSKKGAAFGRRELREKCGWSLTQVRAHLDRLVELEYLAPRCGRMGSSFVYDLLVTEEAALGVPLIDVGALKKHAYDRNLAGRNGHLAGGGEVPPPAVKCA